MNLKETVFNLFYLVAETVKTMNAERLQCTDECHAECAIAALTQFAQTVRSLPTRTRFIVKY